MSEDIRTEENSCSAETGQELFIRSVPAFVRRSRRTSGILRRPLDCYGELIGAGSGFSSAKIALQNADQPVGIHSFAELGDCFEIPVAAADKRDVADGSVNQVKVDFRGTDILRIIRIMHFTIHDSFL